MSKIAIHTYTAQSGREFRSLKMEDVFKMLGMPEQAQIGCGLTPDGKTLLLWEPRAAKEAKAKGIMGKPLAKLAQPAKEGAADNGENKDIAALKADVAAVTATVNRLAELMLATKAPTKKAKAA